MTTPVRSVPPIDRAGSSASWAGEKRRKTVGEGPPQVQEEQGVGQEPDESVFSAEDVIDRGELSLCYDQLYRRESFFNEPRSRMRDEDTEHVYKRLCSLRYRDYKILKVEQDWDPTDCPWDSPFEPGPSIFGWTYDPETFNLNGLDDYQRIVPTRVDFYEYPQYDAYRFTFSDQRTDEEYVKYYNEISKKIKWVEEYMRRDKQEFELKFERTSHRQSMKIAKGFPHLSMTLAQRGYEEYLLDLAWKLSTQDYVRVYFEVWDRVSKNEMSFEDALKSALPVFGYSCNCRIMGQLLGYHNLVLEEFETCKAQIPEGVADKDEVLKHITDAVYKIKSAERPKLYLDYVKKKIEVAQRLHLYDPEVPRDSC
ncbi:unnamed protein product [Urochloa decumbens]|uniref:Uncharacterized protein n=1 Tax=Urochloa decumbens TaxID=240449 RepID=A0ABC9C423_9POAL